jgi:hypothetical protein
MDGLRALGLAPVLQGGLVIVEVELPIGPRAGQKINVGADPPADFPLVPPHWLHLRQDLDLPDSNKTASELGADWAKWSRPHKQWRGGESAARQWLAHVYALLARVTL